MLTASKWIMPVYNPPIEPTEYLEHELGRLWVLPERVAQFGRAPRKIRWASTRKA